MDKKHALSTLREYAHSAYQTEKRVEFEKAAQILYGPEFIVMVGLKGRMQFHCVVCRKNMNHECALSDHSHTGAHLKSLDKRKGCSNYSQDSNQYEVGSLQQRLLQSKVKAVGLQLVNEFRIHEKDSPYYMCNICGSHGIENVMYLHLIGSKHTDKYIHIRLEGTPSSIKSESREHYREFILKCEGQRIGEIHRVTGKEYFPNHLASMTAVKVQDKEGNSLKRPLDPCHINTNEPTSSLEAQTTGAAEFQLVNVKEEVISPDEALVGCSTSDLTQGDSNPIGIRVESVRTLESVESVMGKLQQLDNLVPALFTPEDVSGCLQTAFNLAHTLFNITDFQKTITVEAAAREKLDNRSTSLTKVLGRIKYVLLPTVQGMKVAKPVEDVTSVLK